MQLKILSTNSLLKSIVFLINYALNSICNIENMLKIILSGCYFLQKCINIIDFIQTVFLATFPTTIFYVTMWFK